MNQPALFDPHGESIETPPWMVARDAGMARAAAGGEAAVPRFAEQVSELVVRHLREHGQASSEELTEAAKGAGLQPKDDRAFGPVYASLSRRGVIVAVGECRRKRGHGSRGGTVWRLADGQ